MNKRNLFEELKTGLKDAKSFEEERKMRSSINEAITSTVSNMLEAELKASFIKKELDK